LGGLTLSAIPLPFSLSSSSFEKSFGLISQVKSTWCFLPFLMKWLGINFGMALPARVVLKIG
jgi:hypothetical protein